MLNKFLILSLMCFLACGMGSQKPELPKPPVPDIGVETLPARHNRLIRIEVKSLKGFDQPQEIRFRHIAANTQNVVNLILFEDLIKSHVYGGKNQFVDTYDLPGQVFEKISASPWILEYRLERLRSSTIGYTLKDVPWIALNSSKWYLLSDAEISANICHEYAGHKLGGYSHAKYWSESRDYSAPYALGSYCKALYKRTVR